MCSYSGTKSNLPRHGVFHQGLGSYGPRCSYATDKEDVGFITATEEIRIKLLAIIIIIILLFFLFIFLLLLVLLLQLQFYY